jgi:regulator of ribonuclease activity A
MPAQGGLPPTCDLCDAHRADDSGRLRVLAPVYASFGGRMAFGGRVRTVRCLEDNTSVKALLEAPGDGAVLVVDGGGSVQRALVGGTIATSAARNGWVGVVVHGAVRDAAEIAACQLGVRALALCPMPSQRRRDGEVDVPLELGGVTIRPGDWLVADADGIVVLDEAPPGWP